jgi:light-harvesting complex 1 alpha chain
MVFDPRRALVAAAVLVAAIALLIHFVVLSSPRYCDHLGWCAPAPAAAAARAPAAR